MSGPDDFRPGSFRPAFAASAPISYSPEVSARPHAGALRTLVGAVCFVLAFAGGWLAIDRFLGGGSLERVDIARIEQPVAGYQYLPMPEAETLFDQFISTVPEAEEHLEDKTVRSVFQDGRQVGAIVGITLKDVDQSDFDDLNEGFTSGATQVGTVGEMDLDGAKAYTATGPRGAVVGWQYESAFVMVSARSLPEAQTLAAAIAAQIEG